MDMLNEEKHHQYHREQVKELFNNLVESLKNDLFDVNSSINDIQIEVLWNRTKLDLETFKNQFLILILNASEFNSIFLDLVNHIQGAYNVMQTIFKHLTVKTNTIIEKNNQLCTDLANVRDEIKTLHKKENDVSVKCMEQIQKLQDNELKRLEKEKNQEKKY